MALTRLTDVATHIGRPIYVAMKTTVDISDPLLRKARTVAAKRRTTLRALIEQGLRQVLTERPSEPFKLRDARYGGGGLTPEAERIAGGAGWEKIRRFAYDDWMDGDEKR